MLTNSNLTELEMANYWTISLFGFWGSLRSGEILPAGYTSEKVCLLENTVSSFHGELVQSHLTAGKAL